MELLWFDLMNFFFIVLKIIIKTRPDSGFISVLSIIQARLQKSNMIYNSAKHMVGAY